MTAESLTRTAAARGVVGRRSTPCPTGCRSPRDRSSRWPTSGSSPASPAACAVAEYLGVTLPTTPSTSVESETVTAIWLGPDEWLITSPFRTPEELEIRAAGRRR